MPISYRANSETIAATTAQTVTFADNTLPQGGIGELFIETTGANNALDVANGLIGVRVKLEGVAVLDITGPQLRVLLESLSPANTIPATGRLSFTIPMSYPFSNAPIWNWNANLGGIPFGVKTSVELVLGTSSSAGTALVGWRLLPNAPQYMLKAVQQSTGLAASTTNGRVQVNYGANQIYGFILPTVGSTGITRLRIVSMDSSGKETQVFHADRTLLLESQFAGNPSTVTNPFVLKLPEPVVLPAGSYLEIDNGAGSAATDVFAALQVVNVAPAKQ
jgi:hypothetical protein